MKLLTLISHPQRMRITLIVKKIYVCYHIPVHVKSAIVVFARSTCLITFAFSIFRLKIKNFVFYRTLNYNCIFKNKFTAIRQLPHHCLARRPLAHYSLPLHHVALVSKPLPQLLHYLFAEQSF
jgi:hypothetical protein